MREHSRARRRHGRRFPPCPLLWSAYLANAIIAYYTNHTRSRGSPPSHVNPVLAHGTLIAHGPRTHAARIYPDHYHLSCASCASDDYESGRGRGRHAREHNDTVISPSTMREAWAQPLCSRKSAPVGAMWVRNAIAAAFLAAFFASMSSAVISMGRGWSR